MITLGEFFTGSAGKFKRLLGERQPLFNPMPGIVKQLFKSGFFLEQFHPLTAIFFVRTAGFRPCCLARSLSFTRLSMSPQALLICPLLGLNDVVSRRAFAFMQFMQVFDSPFLETLGNLDAGEILVNLPFKLTLRSRTFVAHRRFFALGAMVIGIMEDRGIDHFL